MPSLPSRPWSGPASLLALLLLLAGCASGAPPGATPAAPTEPAVPGIAAPERPATPPVQPGVPATEPEPAPGLPLPREAPEGWHLLDAETDAVEGAGVARAHAELLAGRAPARTVVVAILDSGVDTAHVALRPLLWRNTAEIPGTGADDDGNGYVDDALGWSFLGSPGGEAVDKDTWEVTRLYALCQNPARAPPAPPPLPEAEKCERVEREFEAQVAEARTFLGNVQGIAEALRVVVPILERAVGDTLTTQNVAALRSVDLRVREAQSFYLQLADLGATPADVEAAVEDLEAQLAYKLNPDFDPRPRVGDDYTDLTERFYGHPDVMGPDASHGTHVAGIVASVFAGVPAVELMAVRAVPDGDERDKDVANAIRYAVDNGAHVINMSFGKGYSPQKAVVDEAVRYADERGVLLVHAAGNDGKDLADSPNFPSRSYLEGGEARNWITVGASSWRGADTLVAPFSNYGQAQVDLFAPGVDITSAVPGGGFEANSGTSMAAPLVAGVAALVMAYYPELTAAQVRAVLLETATRHTDRPVLRPGEPGGGDGSGDGASGAATADTVAFGTLSVTGGVVNAWAALRRAGELASRGQAGAEAPLKAGTP